ncbi:site-specific integrase [Streptococcus dysgalactiae subsp. dysgalactiae]|nr:site-specific integrase [Streptococcus dysgalactiae subsp. dysgalactiae]
MATYRQRGKKKLWDYRIYDKKGKLIASGSGFRTKKEASYEALKIEQKKYNSNILQSNITIFEMWQKWYNLVIEPSDLDILTKQKYQARGKLIEKYLSHLPANRIKHSNYQEFLKMYGQKVTINLMTCLNSDIRKVIIFFQRDGMLIDDFTKGVKVFGKPYKKSPDEKYLKSIEDYKSLLQFLNRIADYSDSIIPFFLFTMLQTGFRFGEAMAITWQDIDFEANNIYTYRRFSSVKKQFTKPKTRTSIRKVPMSNDLKVLLLKLQDQQEKLLNNLNIKNKDNLIFFDYRFGMISNNAINKYLSNILDELEIESKMTTTGARHTYGSYLLGSGVDIWAVAKLMGHKDIKQLIETYGHLLLEVEEKENEQLLKILNETNDYQK